MNEAVFQPYLTVNTNGRVAIDFADCYVQTVNENGDIIEDNEALVHILDNVIGATTTSVERLRRLADHIEAQEAAEAQEAKRLTAEDAARVVDVLHGEDIDAGVISDYSGRGMFGEQVVAFRLPSVSDLTALTLAFVRLGIDTDLLPKRTDSLGYDVVVY